MDGFTACPERASHPQAARKKCQPIYLESTKKQKHRTPKSRPQANPNPLPIAKITKPQVTTAQPLV